MAKEPTTKTKIHMVSLYQPVSFPNAQGSPTGNTTGTYSTVPGNSGAGFHIEGHPMGVKIKKSEDASYGMIIPSPNIKQIIFLEE